MLRSFIVAARPVLPAAGFAILAMSVLAACASAPNEELPKVTDEGLHLVKETKSSGIRHINGMLRVDLLAGCVDRPCRPVEVSIY